MRLQDTPSDVLIEILVWLRLRDVIAFLLVSLHSLNVHQGSSFNLVLYQTCSSHRRLRDSKYLWITVLEQTQKHRTLACPLGTDVSKLDIEDLQRIAILTYRLEKNWSQDKPRISRAIKVVPCLPELTEPQEEKFGILAAIPGTPFVVLLDGREEPTDIILCDTDGSVPASSIHLGTIHTWAYFDEPGRHLIAIVDTALDTPEYVTVYFPPPTLQTDTCRQTEQIYESSQLTTLPK